jgi:hypothetical protein
MLDFYGPDKPSSFYNYLIEPHLIASFGDFTFRGEEENQAESRLHPESIGPILT